MRIHSYRNLGQNNGNVSIRPSDYIAGTLFMPSDGGLHPFSFEGRDYLYPAYNSPSRRKLLACGRQVEKSTTLGNMCLSYSALMAHFRTLFVSPTETQTEVFSRDKLSTPIKLSPTMQALTMGMTNNVLYKQLTNGSDITLRYAYLNADRIRGIAGIDMLLLDEIQDIITDLIPVIEETQSHSKYKIRIYSGTAKSLDNTISHYWENLSTQNEWVIPCDACGMKGRRHWNILGERNIGLKSLICDKCGKQIYANHQDAQWASMNPNPVYKGKTVNVPFDGYRIPQLIASWIEWDDILDKKNQYPRRQFYNEVLGLGYDAGEKPLTMGALQACSNEDISMYPPKEFFDKSGIFMGIDWGTAENSYTVLCLGKYIGDVFQIFYFKQFRGDEAEPTRQLEIIRELAARYQVTYIGADYGGGFFQNDYLVRNFGKAKVINFQYAASNTKLRYDEGLARFIVNRNAVMWDIINAINRSAARNGSIIQFPRWSEFKDPFAQDMGNLIAEYSESSREVKIDRAASTTDDSFHALVYCFLASMLVRERPDILTPNGEKR